MLTIRQNGTSDDLSYLIEEQETFVIQKSGACIVYSGDQLIREIDIELASLSECARCIYVPIDEYQARVGSMPLWMPIAGLSSSLSIGKLDYSKYISDSELASDVLCRWIYSYDFQFLVSSISNLILSMQFCFLSYYEKLISIQPLKDVRDENGVYEYRGEKSVELAFFIETFFTKAYSIMDIITKIAYEIENPNLDFTKVQKLKCSDVLWGAKKHLHIEKDGTIFEDVDLTRMIETIRNEVVHNGTWEDNPAVFLRIENRKVTERFMLFPDTTEGRLDCFKGRKHFFGQTTKVNDILPEVHNCFLTRLQCTLERLRKACCSNHQMRFPDRETCRASSS